MKTGSRGKRSQHRRAPDPARSREVTSGRPTAGRWVLNSGRPRLTSPSSPGEMLDYGGGVVNLGQIHIKLTILKCTLRRHLAHSRCCADSTSVSLRNLLITPRRRPNPSRGHSLPASPIPGNRALLSVPTHPPVLDMSRNCSHTPHVPLCLVSLSRSTFPGPSLP